ncbi:hypothetical protein B0H10DRAFT_2119277 [Mycena sp. CBHHK59/15]|nr:hypothetical protein B0H10DRAFT_2119277 [Mycena sp. CBHHK59/15]
MTSLGNIEATPASLTFMDVTALPVRQQPGTSAARRFIHAVPHACSPRRYTAPRYSEHPTALLSKIELHSQSIATFT